MFYEYTHLGSVDYLKLESGRNFCFPPHLHRCFEIIVLLSGEMTVTVDQIITRLSLQLVCRVRLLFPDM